MRVAIWSAVSSKAQATLDKTSLQDQVRHGTQVIKDNGWKLYDKYIVPGESRTAFISLSHAEEKISELHRLLEDASKHRFDIVFIYDLNRFRNLMLQVFEVLTDYNIQFYNYDAPQTIYPPEEYTPERKNANRLTIKLSDIISGQETNTLKKQFRDKMPARITEKKLHAGLGLPPYAYRKPPQLHPNRRTHPRQRHPPSIHQSHPPHQNPHTHHRIQISVNVKPHIHTLTFSTVHTHG